MVIAMAAALPLLYEIKPGLGGRLRKARKAAGFAQQDVGGRLGVTRSAVSQWEIDDTRPEYHNLQQLAHLLKVDFVWLVSGHGKGPKTIPDQQPGQRVMVQRMRRLIAAGQFDHDSPMIEAMRRQIASGKYDDMLRRMGYVRRPK